MLREWRDFNSYGSCWGKFIEAAIRGAPSSNYPGRASRIFLLPQCAFPYPSDFTPDAGAGLLICQTPAGIHQAAGILLVILEGQGAWLRSGLKDWRL